MKTHSNFKIESMAAFKQYIKENSKEFYSGTLRFYGDWFGRSMDNIHRPKEIYFENSTFCVLFSDDYLLKVTEPDKITFDSNLFSIRTASTVRYEYGHYGLSNEERIRFIEYTPTDNGVIKSKGLIDDAENAQRKHLHFGHNAFEIYGGPYLL